MEKERKPGIVSLGDVAWDFLLEVSEEICWGSDVQGKVEFSYGGSACNFAVWASRKGARVRLIGKVGMDLLGNMILAHLKEEGVNFPFPPVPNARTARIGVFVSPKGERGMVMDKDPGLSFHSEDFSPTLVEGFDLLFFTGYAIFHRPSIEFFRMILSEARNQGLLTAFDPSSFHLMEDFGYKELRDLVSPLDFLLLNEDEARRFSPQGDFRDLLSFSKIAVIKRGELGAIALSGSGEFSSPAFPSPVLDTTGAGDAFDAGFLVEYLKSKNIEESLKEGNMLGSYVVSHLGAQPPWEKKRR
ncbi:MAG: carbohydrate kinase family protein [Caldiserica bacterium]|jgi:sugar/nucleoside kinase (ribokinase family)|nr:carbohydrate kinase family protein [Caldisericota bacterium]MDH7563009.1 carbohydrate kinase family protein [Caldisericota bacterium]